MLRLDTRHSTSAHQPVSNPHSPNRKTQTQTQAQPCRKYPHTSTVRPAQSPASTRICCRNCVSSAPPNRTTCTPCAQPTVRVRQRQLQGTQRSNFQSCRVQTQWCSLPNTRTRRCGLPPRNDIVKTHVDHNDAGRIFRTHAAKRSLLGMRPPPFANSLVQNGRGLLTRT